MGTLTATCCYEVTGRCVLRDRNARAVHQFAAGYSLRLPVVVRDGQTETHYNRGVAVLLTEAGARKETR